MAETVTIERAEYERLLDVADMLEDMQAYDRAMAELDCDALLPDAFMARLLEGESPLKVYREWRGHSVAGLSRQSGVKRVQIHDIEAGRSPGVGSDAEAASRSSARGYRRFAARLTRM